MTRPPLTYGPLGPGNLRDFTDFVEADAFSDNPAWAGCYCVFPYAGDGEGGEFDPRASAPNKALLTRMVHEGRGHWLLARHEGELMGWVNADLLSHMPRHSDWGTLLPGETGIISCFVVHPRHRRRGVATELLGRAVSALREMGADQVESWVARDPARAAAPPLGPDQAAHRGPLPMYVRAGFAVVEEDDGWVRVRRTFDQDG